MVTPASRPFPKIVFGKSGDRQNAGPLVGQGVTDLIVISHGWHQDGDDATEMYEAIVAGLEAEANATGRLVNARLGVLAVHWPSDKYRDDLALELISNVSQGQETVAASLGGDADEALAKRAEQLADLFSLSADELVGATQRAANGGEADQDALVTLIRRAIALDEDVDEELRAEHAELLDPDRLGREIFEALTPSGVDEAPISDEGQGAALGLFSGLTATVARVLNQFAYFELKKRAGKIGAKLGAILDSDPGLEGVNLHLVGHSFGARLVTSATNEMDRRPKSLTLLQGAFSHNALGIGDRENEVPIGAYRNVVAMRKPGRVVISHTWNDRAVGLAYAAASRVSNTVASALIKVSDEFGGAKDRFGGIGANGALLLETGETHTADFDGAAAPALGALVNSFRCDFIRDHSDIRGRGVARLLLAAMD